MITSYLETKDALIIRVCGSSFPTAEYLKVLDLIKGANDAGRPYRILTNNPHIYKDIHNQYPDIVLQNLELVA